MTDFYDSSSRNEQLLSHYTNNFEPQDFIYVFMQIKDHISDFTSLPPHQTCKESPELEFSSLDRSFELSSSKLSMVLDQKLNEFANKNFVRGSRHDIGDFGAK